MADNRSYVYRRLRGELGLTPAQAAGAVGGLGGESGPTLDPNAVNPRSGALGIGQWLGGRAQGVTKGDLRGQVNHLISELKGSERGALNRLRGARTVDDATRAWVESFERPSAAEIRSSMPARLAYSREALNRFHGLSGGGGGSMDALAGRVASSRGSTTTNLPGATFKTTVPTVDQSAFESARRNAIIGQLIARRNPNSILLRSGLLSTVEPSLSEFMGQQTTTSRVPGKTVTVPGVAAAAPAGGIDPRAKPGVPVARLSSEGGTHPTAGLAGFPARDYFAKPGTAAVAPVNGKVVRLSGHDPAQGPTQGPHGPLGWSVYIQGNDGHTYFLTHMGTRNVKPGQRVRAGQRIGTVANYDKYGTPSHIHMGVH
jgi:murein DD-endopeptidase MepM/ murein hydrolase activator NlpD